MYLIDFFNHFIDKTKLLLTFGESKIKKYEIS
jgi:hypothetical protein